MYQDQTLICLKWLKKKKKEQNTEHWQSIEMVRTFLVFPLALAAPLKNRLSKLELQVFM